MAYTVGVPKKAGSQVIEQCYTVDITLDTSTSGTVVNPYSGFVPETILLQNMGAVACVASVNLAATTATSIALLSNGTAGVYRLFLKSVNQQG